MQGIFMQDGSRPKSKKAIKEALARSENIMLEATSFFGNEYGGDLKLAPPGDYCFVGPDPHVKRNFYGSIHISPDGKVTIK